MHRPRIYVEKCVDDLIEAHDSYMLEHNTTRQPQASELLLATKAGLYIAASSALLNYYLNEKH